MNILVSDLKKSYNKQIAVNSISFELEESQIIGFLGPNGAGKSTTIKMLMGLLPPDSGKIKIHDPSEIGYLSEENPLYSEMYIREFLHFIGSLKKIKNENLKKRVEEVIEFTGLTIEQNKKIKELSKGYKQRVGIAQAILHDPKVLILDEPTSGLDPLQMEEIRNLIKKIGRNKTILFSSHILSEVEAICDKILIIHQGNLVANQSMSEIKKEGSLENFFKKSVH